MNPEQEQPTTPTPPSPTPSFDQVPEQPVVSSGAAPQAAEIASSVSMASAEPTSTLPQIPIWQLNSSPTIDPVPVAPQQPISVSSVVPSFSQSAAPAPQPVMVTQSELTKVPGDQPTQPDQSRSQNAGTQTMPTHFSLADSPTPITTQPIGSTKRRTFLRKPTVLAGLIVAGALLLIGGIVFGLYLPNTPESIYDASLSNTASALDRLIDYSDHENAVGYKGIMYDGTFTVKSPGASADATMSGASDGDANATFSATLDAMGQKGTVNVRSVHVAGNTSPDVYIQVEGINSWLEQAGLDGTMIDGQWIAIDHTLIDTYTARLKSSGASVTSPANALQSPSYVELSDAARKVQMVNKQYLFTTDGSRAVLQEKKFVATEMNNGRTVNHYTVGWNKQHLTAYVDALKMALDNSKLNVWAKASSGSNLGSLITMAPNADRIADTYTFDLWVDNSTRLVNKLEFMDPSDPSSVFTLSQNYQGGATYPFTITSSSKNLDGSTTTTAAGFTIDTSTHKYTFVVNEAISSTTSQTTLAMTIHATPSNEPVKVTAPTGTKSIVDVLNSLGLGALGSDLSGDSGSAPLSSPFVLQQ